MWPCATTWLLWDTITYQEPWMHETGTVSLYHRAEGLQWRRCSGERFPSTDARGPSVAWGFYISWFSAAWKWLMPTVITLLLGSRSCFSLVIAWTLSLLHCNFCLRLVLRPGDSWAPGVSLVLLAAEGGGLAPLAQCWRCSHCLWNAVPGVLGPPQRERRKGGVEERGGGGGGWGGDLWTVPSGSYDSIFNLGSKTEDKVMETEEGNKEIGWKDDALVWGPER